MKNKKEIYVLHKQRVLKNKDDEEKFEEELKNFYEHKTVKEMATQVKNI